MTATVRPARGSWSLNRLSKPAASRLWLIGGSTAYVAAIVEYLAVRGASPVPWLAIGCVAALLPAAWLPVHVTRPSQVLYWLLWLLAYVPATIVPFALGQAGTPYLPFVAVVAVVYAAIGLATHAPRYQIPRPRIPPHAFWTVALALGFGLAVAIVRVLGIHLGWVQLSDVYAVRGQYKDVLAGSGPLTALAVGWEANVVSPLFLAYGLARGKLRFIALGLAGEIFVYTLTGFRTALFTGALLLILLVALRFGRRAPGLVLAWGAAVIVVGTQVADAVLGTGLFASLFVRRLLILPGQIVGFFHDFFSSHPFALFGDSVLRGVVPYPYRQSIPSLIGDHYFGSQTAYANGSFLADAFANAGLVGVVLIGILVAGLLIAIDVAALRENLLVASLLLAIPAVELSNTALFTSLWSHGVGLVLVVIWLLPRGLMGEPSDAASRARRVAILTTVHEAGDVRIFLKEARSLASAGYDVALVAPGDGPDRRDGVRIHYLRRPSGRLERAFATQWRCWRLARRLDAALYHIHDPELIPTALLLRLSGAEVVYDAHEDVPKQVRSKTWLPSGLRFAVSRGAALAEWIASRTLSSVVAATPAIAAKFPQRRCVIVQNFPILGELGRESATPYAARPRRIAYVGGMTQERGVLELIEAVGIANGRGPVRLTLAGAFWPEELHAQALARPGSECVDFAGQISRPEVANLLGQSRAGVVTFLPRPNHLEALPNKLFEYMSAGIPVLASDFPLWREIVEDAGCGLVVDPTDPASIAAGITWLLEHPEEASQMGERGKRAVTERYRWDTQAETLVGLYARLIGRPDASLTTPVAASAPTPPA